MAATSRLTAQFVRSFRGLPATLSCRFYGARKLSSNVPPVDTNTVPSPTPTPIPPPPAPPHTIFTDHQTGRQYAAVDMTRHPKLKPSIVKRRIAALKTFEGQEKNIRHSPWRLNLVCQLAAGLPLPQALTQLEFCKKSMAPRVQKVLQRTANLADIRHGITASQLEVAECFATRGTPLKRIKPMGRGRTGRMEHRHAHFRVVLREIDFKLKFYQAMTVSQKKKWLELEQRAKQDAQVAQGERQRIAQLEQQLSEQAVAKKNKNSKK